MSREVIASSSSSASGGDAAIVADEAGSGRVDDVLERHVAERVLLDVEEAGRLRRANRLERVEQRPPADEERRGHADVGVHLGQQLERLAARVRIERELVEREVRALGEERRAPRRPQRSRCRSPTRIVAMCPPSARRHQASRPPSTVYEEPVTNDASSEARNATTAATSSGRPIRPDRMQARPISCSAAAGSSWLSR